MPALLVYLIILAIAASVTFALFGEVGEAEVAPADALELFASATPTASGATPLSLEAAAETKTGGDDCGARTNHAMSVDESGMAHIKSLLTKCGVPPQQQEMISFLGRHCCVLPVKSNTVRVLNHPAVFYEELKRRVTAAQRSITLSALYIGDGPLSRDFVACLEERVRWAAAGGHPFSITILLDYNRMQDRKNLVSLKALMELAQQTASTASLPVDAVIAGANASSPVTRSPSTLGSSSIFADGERDAEEDEAVRGGRSDGASAATSATAAAASTGVKVNLFLYQNPSKWNRLFAPFGRAKEALGVQHTKIFVFDQRHTILTGANLSDDYFATRMDRYMIVEDNALVARWFTQLVRTENRMSHPVVCRKEFAKQLTGGGDTCASRTPNKNGALGHSSSAASPSSRIAAATANGSAPEPLQSLLRWVAERVIRAVSPPLTSLVSQREGSPTLHRKSNLVILANALQVDPSVDTEAFCARANALLHDFAAWARRLCAAAKVDWRCYDTFLFPTVQAGRAGVYHDSVIVKQLLRLSTNEDHIFLASPYLNMYASFVDEVLHGTSYVDCITASVQTNGWNGQKGMAGRIPFFYLQLERSFYYLMKAYNCLRRVHIREFSVKGLTFHAKGLWFMGRRCSSAAASSPGKDGEGDARQHHGGHGADAAAADPCPPECISAPYLVAYGSTNYGYRSVHKDVEVEAFLLTTNDALREMLRQELLFLLQQSVPVTETQFVGTAMGRFQPVISLIAHLGHDFL
ncbi:phosphatidylglycerophosphate synthase-like protein [Leishmania mexicana MHOM/GT/2001/U1103]|uniref:CDP-diacylglycerol--glycerol-3-phosphate 3-phosphatidyltransferase n=1 Tax=Leishmania mexicana (strain MHOM/GT/2001/U1103) TaxID=929439 RepID=E9AL30_LEIMU|nr:phosphatidylglycerophosphate synthase-like protein [Leishmania mexicana MHOM/GT/2001/U1103]CBZ23633.1 phosphatidylglycerophosphate synthase-like protein [Leishmania mexicana MHOM/GT/2001/U1103]